MKALRYIVLFVFTVAYAVGIAIDIAMFFFSGLGGPYPYLWVFPLHFIIGTFFLIIYIVSLRPNVANSSLKAAISAILLVIILPLPILYVSLAQKKSEEIHSEYEKTCRIVRLDGYDYNFKFCPGKPGTFGPTGGPIDFSVGSEEFNRAMKVWDEKGWAQFKSETEWYYK